MATDEDDSGRNLLLIAVAVVVGLGVLVVGTVVLAAVIGAFVLDLGSAQATAPDAGLSFDDTDEGVVVRYSEGDDPVDPSSLVLEVNGDYRGTWAGLEDTHADDRTIRLSDVESGDHVTVRWSGENGPQLLGKHTAS